jgi:hypothetical protein
MKDFSFSLFFVCDNLADEKKRKEVFNWLREKKMTVDMLQETHFTKQYENIIEGHINIGQM